MAKNDGAKKTEGVESSYRINSTLLGVLTFLFGLVVTLSLYLHLIATWLQRALVVVSAILCIILAIVLVTTFIGMRLRANKKTMASVIIIAAIVVAVLGVTLTAAWITQTEAPVPYVTSGITITNPANGDSINSVNVTLRGTSKLNITNQSIWVLVYPHNLPSRFYPQQSVKIEEGGRWECNVYLGTNNTSTLGKYDIYAVLVDNASATIFQNYLANSNEQQSWPGLSSQPGVITSDQITLTRVQ